jgi:pimeloyl-ACP methyl ester carboxylesterase
MAVQFEVIVMDAGTTRTPAVVIFLGGLQSHSLETPGDHGLGDDFEALQGRLLAAEPTRRCVFFSYRAGALLKAGLDPLLAWRHQSYDDANEPIYCAMETTDRPVADHVAGLEWLIGDLIEKHPCVRIDLIGFSLGGIVSLAWAADADDRLLASIHRIVLISSPVGGITPLGLLAPKAGIRHALQRYQVDFGQGRVFDDLQASSSAMSRLCEATRLVDVSSVENSRDYLINGHRITGQVILPIWVRTIALGRGVAASGFLPADQCYVADLGGWDRRLRVTHRQILSGTSAAVQRAHDHIADLLGADGPRWRERWQSTIGAVPATLNLPERSQSFA